MIAAPELGAVLLGGALSLETDKPLVLVRKEAKEYGTSKAIEGRLERGQKVTVVEDVLTTGGEAIKAAEKVRRCSGSQISPSADLLFTGGLVFTPAGFV